MSNSIGAQHWLKHYEDSERKAEEAAGEVVREAMQIWALEEDGGYRDDISIIIVLLPCWPERKGPRSLGSVGQS